MNIFSTGQAARILEVTEPQLAEVVRRGRLNPPPRVLAGRRLWTAEQIVLAAEALDQPKARVLQRLAEEVQHGS